MDVKTLPALLRRNAARYGSSRTALREKVYGIWQPVSWEQYYEHVKYFALGLRSLGFRKEDKLAIIGDNRPEWLYAELAAQSLGGLTLGIYQDSMLTEVAYLVLFRALKDRLGFSRLRTGSTAGAALGADVFRLFHALGINLKQIYGQTEISGISCIHRRGNIDFDTVGMPIPATEIRIHDPDPSGVGEIVSRSPALFQGYYRDPEATARTVREGWLHSGDAGYFNKAGHLVCIDRLSDLMRLEDGTQFSPMYIENKLTFCPYIVEAVVLGHEKPYVSAMICIDFKHNGNRAEERRLVYTTYTDLAFHPARRAPYPTTRKPDTHHERQSFGSQRPPAFPRCRHEGSSLEANSPGQSSCNVDGFVKSPSAALRFIFRHCGVLLCTPHFSRFARLASGAFYCAVCVGDFLRSHQRWG